MKRRVLAIALGCLLILSIFPALSCMPTNKTSTVTSQTTSTYTSYTYTTTTPTTIDYTPTTTWTPTTSTTTWSPTTTTTTYPTTTSATPSTTWTTEPTTTATTATITTPTTTKTTTPTTTITPVLPQLLATPDMLAFKVNQGAGATKTGAIRLSTDSAVALNWSLTKDMSWLTATPASGTLVAGVPVDITVTVTATGSEALSSYPSWITVSAPGTQEPTLSLPVWLWVTDGSAYVYEGGARDVNGRDQPVELLENPAAHNPTWAELVAFITQDLTDTIPYVARGPDGFVCADFATLVHNNAEAAGIRAAWVGLDLTTYPEGHALDAFETTDRGLVYIDCTGGKLDETYQNLVRDTVAFISPGQPYGLIDINYVDSPEYPFYMEYVAKCDRYKAEVAAYNDELARYNAEISANTYYEGTPEWERVLEWQMALEQKYAELNALRAELSDSWYDPMGNVTGVYAYW